MVVRIDKPQLRETRLKLYGDYVFFLIHKQLGPLLTKEGLSLFELFATADAFTEYMLENEISVPSYFDFEVDDLKSELDFEQDLPLILIICYYKMLAMLPTTPTTAGTGLLQPAMAATAVSGPQQEAVAATAEKRLEEESPLVTTQKAYFAYCQTNPAIMKLMAHFGGCEEKLRAEYQQKGDQYTYRLLTLVKEEENNLEGQIELIQQQIGQRDSLDISTLQDLELIIRRVSAKYKGAFDEMADGLQHYIAERMSMTTGHVHVTGDYVVKKQIDKQVNGVGNNGVGFSINPAS